MIKGLTHDENGVLDSVTKYKGKLGTGYAPGEGPNKSGGPQAAGFFRMLKETTTTTRVGASQKEVVIKQWVLNEAAQAAIETACKSKQPRVVEVVCLHKNIDEMWESSLGMFATDGLICKSYGKGTNARHLTFDSEGERVWEDRVFGDVKGCPMRDCPDYKEGRCTPHGLLKCFPVADLSPNPYRFETKSYTTIRGIESQLNSFWALLCAAHSVKVAENQGKPLPFDGFFGCKFYLVHKKAKSGGREIFVTDIMPTPAFTKMVMEPIKRGLIVNQRAALNSGGSGAINLLSASADALVGSTTTPQPAVTVNDIAEQQQRASEEASEVVENLEAVNAILAENKTNPKDEAGVQKALDGFVEKQ